MLDGWDLALTEIKVDRPMRGAVATQADTGLVALYVSNGSGSASIEGRPPSGQSGLPSWRSDTETKLGLEVPPALATSAPILVPLRYFARVSRALH